VRIPLDYYRILGLPLAASDEQVRQAYSDRVVQLPRREYSQTAIFSRKQLIEEAYVVLSNPQERSAYDKVYLAHAYDQQNGGQGVAVETHPVGSVADINTDVNHEALSIEISQNELTGALLILQELGEYEQVLQLGSPFLVNKNSTNNGTANGHQSEVSQPDGVERSDVILTVALGCLELGREQWQQGNYENAATSLETGEELLIREGLFPNVQGEIAADLCKLRPYRILELLALPIEKVAQRRLGLQLLQDILDERLGIDGTGNDQSGLNIDDFLRFIQQLRNHLTSLEQHKIFEAESQRPSAVATYLAFYALIARGFKERQPALIYQAKQMLTPLGKRQDVHLEQALCALLLGQTEEASRTLELSQEYEALVVIRENSQDSPDLLPGLCLYGERWLQNDVFPNFRDLANQQVSLKEYFADPEVQNYLENLPVEVQRRGDWTTATRSHSSVQPIQTPGSINSSVNGSTNSSKRPTNTNVLNGQVNNRRTSDSRVTQTQSEKQLESTNYSAGRTAAPTSTTVNSQVGYSTNSSRDADRFSRIPQEQNNGVVRNGGVKPGKQPKQQKQQKQSKQSQARRRRKSPSSGLQWGEILRTPRAKIRFVWLIFGGLMAIFGMWLILAAALGFFKNLFTPAPTLHSKGLMVTINQPTVAVPDINSKLIAPSGLLTAETAETIILTWLSSKALAFGPNHEFDSLNHILTGSALAYWKKNAEIDKAANRYRRYKHQLTKIEFVSTSKKNPNKASVDATVKEGAEFYEKGEVNLQKSYDETVRVRYNLVRQDGAWLIESMSQLGKI
jgi:ARC6-like, IMS domain/DnaJ domain